MPAIRRCNPGVSLDGDLSELGDSFDQDGLVIDLRSRRPGSSFAHLAFSVSEGSPSEFSIDGTEQLGRGTCIFMEVLLPSLCSSQGDRESRASETLDQRIEARLGGGSS